MDWIQSSSFLFFFWSIELNQNTAPCHRFYPAGKKIIVQCYVLSKNFSTTFNPYFAVAFSDLESFMDELSL